MILPRALLFPLFVALAMPALGADEPQPPELSEASRVLLEKREQGKASFADVQRHAGTLTEGRADFVRAAAALERRLIGKEREEKVGKAKAGIADTEAKLTWSDAALQKLAPDKTVVEIRVALAARLDAEKSKLRAIEKTMQIRELELEAFEKPAR